MFKAKKLQQLTRVTQSELDYEFADHANFKNYDLHKLNFCDTSISFSRFENCDLSYAIFEEKTILNTKFINCNCTGIRLKKATLEGVSFIDCNMERAKMTEAELAGAKFYTVDLSHADMRSSIITDSCEFKSVKFNRTNLNDSSILSATAWKSSLKNAKTKNCDLDGLTIEKKY